MNQGTPQNQNHAAFLAIHFSVPADFKPAPATQANTDLEPQLDKLLGISLNLSRRN
jgi:hypothetical protein